MKKILTYILFLNLFPIFLFADWGFYDIDRSWIGINVNGVTTNYKLFDGGNTSGSGYFDGSNLGTLTSPTQTFGIQFWDIKTWKNGSSDVQQAKLFYRIYEQGSPSGSFIEVTGGWLQDLGDGNQKWGKSTLTLIDISNLDAGKTYVLELYIQVYGTNPDEWKYDSNSGNNYKANFTTDAAFPVEIKGLVTYVFNNKVILNWSTVTEINNYGFEIERVKGDPNTNKFAQWEKIGFVQGNGNSNSVKIYSFEDKNVLTGQYAYRLKQINYDGSYEYSDVVKVDVKLKPSVMDVKNFPNPFNPTTKIRYEIPYEGLTLVKVYDILGNEITTLVNEYKDAGIYEAELDGSKLSNGIYLIKLQVGNFTKVTKAILMK